MFLAIPLVYNGIIHSHNIINPRHMCDNFWGLGGLPSVKLINIHLHVCAIVFVITSCLPVSKKTKSAVEPDAPVVIVLPILILIRKPL
jgi:hypothetical protein